MSDPLFIDEAMVDQAKEVKARHEDDLLKMPGVVGVGIGNEDGEAVIKVFIKKEGRSASARSAIPANINGLRVVTEETEEFVAY